MFHQHRDTPQLSGPTGRDTEAELLGLDASGQAVTIIKCDAKTQISFLDLKPEDCILMVETVQAQPIHSFKDELDQNVLRQHIVPLVIYFLRHLPCVNAKRRASLAIQMQADNLCVVKTGPISKPLLKFRRPLDLANFDGHRQDL
jgi:hypothetical protein